MNKLDTLPKLSIEKFKLISRDMVSNYICFNCHNVSVKAVKDQHNQLYCEDCYNNNFYNCLSSKNNFLQQAERQENVDDIIAEQTVYCTNRDKCCLWEGKYKNLPSHINGDCNMQIIKCRSDECSKKFIRYSQLSHEKMCLFLQEKCEYCNERVFYIKFHRDNCSVKPKLVDYNRDLFAKEEVNKANIPLKQPESLTGNTIFSKQDDSSPSIAANIKMRESMLQNLQKSTNKSSSFQSTELATNSEEQETVTPFKLIGIKQNRNKEADNSHYLSLGKPSHQQQSNKVVFTSKQSNIDNSCQPSNYRNKTAIIDDDSLVESTNNYNSVVHGKGKGKSKEIRTFSTFLSTLRESSAEKHKNLFKLIYDNPNLDTGEILIKAQRDLQHQNVYEQMIYYWKKKIIKYINGED